MFRIYQPSGKVGLLTLPLWLGGAFLAIGFALIYQQALAKMTSAHINFLLTGGIGWALAVVAARIVEWGRVRSRFWALGIAFSLVSVALGAKFYFQYLGLLQSVTRELAAAQNIPAAQMPEFRREVRRELTFVRHLQMRVERGWNNGRGGRRGGPLRGPLVYLIWAGEAIAILYFACKLPLRQAGKPFNEPHQAWASEEELVMALPISDPAMVDKILAARSVEELLDLPIPKTDQGERVALYTVHSLPGQEMEDAFLSVRLVADPDAPRSEQEKSERILVRYAILPQALREQLMENASLLQEAIEAYREAVATETLAAALAESGVQLGSDAEPADPDDRPPGRT